MLPNAARIITDMPTELHCSVDIGGITIPASACVIVGANGDKQLTEHGRSDGLSEVLYIPFSSISELPDNGKVTILRYGSETAETMRINSYRRIANLYWALTIGNYYG